jgi:transposase, IS5 family
VKLEFEPELAQLDRLLDDDVLFTRVKADLARRYPNSARLGRHSTPVEVILRMLVVKRFSMTGVMSKPSVLYRIP